MTEHHREGVQMAEIREMDGGTDDRAAEDRVAELVAAR